jgi:hypothetical protein
MLEQTSVGFTIDHQVARLLPSTVRLELEARAVGVRANEVEARDAGSVFGADSESNETRVVSGEEITASWGDCAFPGFFFVDF